MNPGLLLAHIRRHVPLSEADEIAVVGWLRPKSVKRKAWLLRAGEVCTQESFILKGCFRMFVTDPNGFDHVMFFCVENWWASDLSSFLTQTPATMSIQALEDSEVLQLSKPGFDTLNADTSGFEHYFRILFQNAFVAQQRRVVHNLTLSAAERYEAFQTTWPLLDQRVPQKDIASYLGITPEFLSLIRRKRAGR